MYTFSLKIFLKFLKKCTNRLKNLKKIGRFVRHLTDKQAILDIWDRKSVRQKSDNLDIVGQY